MEGEASFGSYSTVVYGRELLFTTQSVNMAVERGMKPESVALHLLRDPQPEAMGIFGTGDLGRSLGLRLLQSGYRVVYGSRRPASCGPVPEGAEVTLCAPSAVVRPVGRDGVNTCFLFRWRLTQKQPRKPR